MKYLPVTVYCSLSLLPGWEGDCSNAGITARCPDRLVVPCADGYLDEGQVERGSCIVLEPRSSQQKGEYPIHFVEHGAKRQPMFGGNFVFSSDSRFGKEYGHSPIAVHDRFEG